MFYVNSSQMIEACFCMERMHHKYSQWSMELEEAVMMLDAMDSTREMAAGLRAQGNRIEEQQEMLRQMARGLDKIVVCYQDCERRLCDDMEQEIMTYPVRNAVAVDLNGLRDMLDSMIYK